MHVLVIKKPNKGCLFLYPEQTNNTEQTEQEWLKSEYLRLVTNLDEDLKVYPYEFVDSADLPPKKYKDAIEWDSERGLHVNMEKYNALENSRIYKQRIENRKKELMTKITIEELKSEGKLPSDYTIEIYTGD